jgi:predicted membrane protein
MTGGSTEPGAPGGGGAPLRTLSLALAIALALGLTVYPRAAIDGSGTPLHGALALLLWGLTAGFVHGVGYTPHAAAWRLAFGPWIGLPLMLLGALVLARNVLG